MRIIYPFFCFLLIPCWLAAQEPSPRAKFHQISNLFKQAIADGGGPGASVSIYYKGIQYFQGFGIRQVGKPSEVMPNTLFKIGSTSKVMVAYAILKLAKQGELNLSDPLSKFFPEAHPGLGKLRVEQLLSHTAGLIDQVDYFGPEGKSQQVQYLMEMDGSVLMGPGGEVFSYSNPGYNLLGALIERLTRLEFNGAMQTLVFHDFDMRYSTYNIERVDTNQLAWGHSGSGENLQRIGKLPDNARERASGLLFTNMFDYVVFLGWLADDSKTENADIREQLYRIMADTSMTRAEWAYGLGLFHDKLCSYKSVRHSGALPGYRANFVVVPEEKYAIAVFSNGNTLNQVDLMERATEIMFSQPCEPEQVPKEELRDFSQEEEEELRGLYGQGQGPKIRIFREDNGLSLTRYGEVYQLKKNSRGKLIALNDLGSTAHIYTIVRQAGGEIGYLQQGEWAYLKYE